MPRLAVRAAMALPLILALGSCGDESLFLSPKAGVNDLQIVSASDGQIFAGGRTIPLMVSAPDASTNGDVEVEVTLGTAGGTSVYHNRAAAVVNEPNPIPLPAGLAPGLYRMDLVLYSSGQAVQKKSVSLFIAPDTWRITGIRSFPPVITSAATVMLKAELDVPAGSNPYLRWSWKGKVIQKGLLSAGLGEILWDVPGEGGVYTVTLELFPSAPPQGSDFQFSSSVSLSTDIVVSGSTAQSAGHLGPAASFLTLLRLQGSLVDSGIGAKKAGRTRAAPIGSPQVVSLENGFGYQLDGSSGISVPWLALPVSAGNLGPFTISIGVAFDDLASANRIVAATSADGSFSLVLAASAGGSALEARIAGRNSPDTVIPWGGPPLSPHQRMLLSLSVTPMGSGFIAQWYRDGVQVSRTAVSAPLPAVPPDGTVTIGGNQGFRGVVDEFGVYAYDSSGRPSADPDLYARAQAGRYGSRLVFAAGFDSHALPATFSVSGGGQLSGGRLTLGPGAGLMLPAVRRGGAVDVTVELAPGSGREAAVAAQWRDSTQPAVVAALSPSARELSFQVSADRLSITTASADGTVRVPPPPAGDPALVLTIIDPSGAAADLQVQSVLAVSSK